MPDSAGLTRRVSTRVAGPRRQVIPPGSPVKGDVMILKLSVVAGLDGSEWRTRRPVP